MCIDPNSPGDLVGENEALQRQILEMFRVVSVVVAASGGKIVVRARDLQRPPTTITCLADPRDGSIIYTTSWE